MKFPVSTLENIRKMKNSQLLSLAAAVYGILMVSNSIIAETADQNDALADQNRRLKTELAQLTKKLDSLEKELFAAKLSSEILKELRNQNTPSESSSHELIGKWECIDKSFGYWSLEFERGGRFVFSAGKTVSFYGRWEIGPDGRTIRTWHQIPGVSKQEQKFRMDFKAGVLNDLGQLRFSYKKMSE